MFEVDLCNIGGGDIVLGVDEIGVLDFNVFRMVGDVGFEVCIVVC